jgi:hypothetical protein
MVMAALAIDALDRELPADLARGHRAERQRRKLQDCPAGTRDDRFRDLRRDEFRLVAVAVRRQIGSVFLEDAARQHHGGAGAIERLDLHGIQLAHVENLCKTRRAAHCEKGGGHDEARMRSRASLFRNIASALRCTFHDILMMGTCPSRATMAS